MTAPGQDKLLPKFLAQIENMHVQHIGKRVIVLIEEMFIEIRAGDDLTAMQGEIFKDNIFPRGEGDGLPRAGDRARGGVELHLADDQQAAGLPGAAADDGPQAGKEFGVVERFDQIIIRAGVEPRTRSALRSRAESMSTGVALASRKRASNSQPSRRGSMTSKTMAS